MLSMNKSNFETYFGLEMIALLAYGYWGLTLAEGGMRYVLALLFQFGAAVIWKSLIVVDDPVTISQKGIYISGKGRFMLEFIYFAIASRIIISSNLGHLGYIYLGTIILHYSFGFERVKWLLRH